MMIVAKSEKRRDSNEKNAIETQEKPMRILHYIGSLDIGGSQTMVMNLYRCIDRKTIQFDFVVDRKEELFFKDEIQALGGRVYVLDEHFKGYNYHKFIKQWRVFFQEHPEYGIIHCHVRSVASIVLKIAKQNGLKTICHSHSISNGKGIKSLGKKLLQQRILPYSDYLLACSEESAKWLYGEDIIHDNRCVIINNSIDASLYQFDKNKRKKVRKSIDLDSNIVIGQVGRLEKVKNHSFSLRLIKRLASLNPAYRLLVIGDGSLKKELEREIDDLGIRDNVIMLGSRNNVNELLQGMDIFIMPSLWEGLPMSLIEAQAASLPCVISDKVKSGIIDKQNVKRIPLTDFDAWVNHIYNIDTNDCQRFEKTAIVENSDFNVKKNVEKVFSLYMSLGTTAVDGTVRHYGLKGQD